MFLSWNDYYLNNFIFQRILNFFKYFFPIILIVDTPNSKYCKYRLCKRKPNHFRLGRSQTLIEGLLSGKNESTGDSNNAVAYVKCQQSSVRDLTNSHKGFIYSFIKIRPSSGVIMKGVIVPFDISQIIRFSLPLSIFFWFCCVCARVLLIELQHTKEIFFFEN